MGLGGNLPTDEFGPPRALLGHALSRFSDFGLMVIDRSPWYESAPVPLSDQPWFVNGVVSVRFDGTPMAALDAILRLEDQLGRVRSIKNAARTVDIDIVSAGNQVLDEGVRLQVPHPRLANRAFVVLPLCDIAPDWVHPLTGRRVQDLIATLPKDQQINRMDDGPGLFGTEYQG